MTPDNKIRGYNLPPNKGELEAMFWLLEEHYPGVGYFVPIDHRLLEKFSRKKEENPTKRDRSTEDVIRILNMAHDLGDDGVDFILGMLKRGISSNDPDFIEKAAEYVNDYINVLHSNDRSDEEQKNVTEQPLSLFQRLTKVFKKK